MVNSPRESIREAFSLKILKDEPKYLEMLEDRNMTTHTYKETLAEEIYESLPRYVELMRIAVLEIKNKLK